MISPLYPPAFMSTKRSTHLEELKSSFLPENSRLGTSLWELKGVAVDNCGRDAGSRRELITQNKSNRLIVKKRSSNNNFLSVDETTFTCQTFSYTRNKLSDSR